MKVRAKATMLAALAAAGATAAVAIGSDGEKLRTGLNGFEEVPSVITDGAGTFKARISGTDESIAYELSYSGLEGGEVRQAHIHVGQRDANGNIVVWFCGSTMNPGPAGTPTCPASPGTVAGTFEPADVQEVPAQGFRGAPMTAEERFAKFVRALRAGVAYANVHTATSPGGEIRGQIQDRQDD